MEKGEQTMSHIWESAASAEKGQKKGLYSFPALHWWRRAWDSPRDGVGCSALQSEVILGKNKKQKKGKKGKKKALEKSTSCNKMLGSWQVWGVLAVLSHPMEPCVDRGLTQ